MLIRRVLLPGIMTVVGAAALVSTALAEPMEVYTVTASKAESLGYNGPAPSTELPVVYYVSHKRVSYADLDLTKPEDVALLKKRIAVAALRACKKIEIEHWSSLPDTEQCATLATDRALADLRQRLANRGVSAVAAAR